MAGGGADCGAVPLQRAAAGRDGEPDGGLGQWSGAAGAGPGGRAGIRGPPLDPAVRRPVAGPCAPRVCGGAPAVCAVLFRGWGVALSARVGVADRGGFFLCAYARGADGLAGPFAPSVRRPSLPRYSAAMASRCTHIGGGGSCERTQHTCFTRHAAWVVFRLPVP